MWDQRHNENTRLFVLLDLSMERLLNSFHQSEHGRTAVLKVLALGELCKRPLALLDPSCTPLLKPILLLDPSCIHIFGAADLFAPSGHMTVILTQPNKPSCSQQSKHHMSSTLKLNLYMIYVRLH